MNRPYLCLCLTAKTLEEDLAIARRYHDYIDMVELRADYLDCDERLYIRRFPSMCDIPAILTIRRKCDGGNFVEGEGARVTMFGRAMALSDIDEERKFLYVDFEEDFRVAGLQDAALAFGMTIIRSEHVMSGNVANIQDKLRQLGRVPYELPKLAYMPRSLSDITDLFKATRELTPYAQILCAMGSYAMPARILASRIRSRIAYCTPQDDMKHLEFLGQVDPVTINSVYRFRSITPSTAIYGITGFPLKATSSPKLHNKGYEAHKVDAVFIPIKADTVMEALDFANTIGMKGLSVTVPHKENMLSYLSHMSEQVKNIGACNTCKTNQKGEWVGYNTDTNGFKRALVEFLGGSLKDTRCIRHKKVAVIGAGGAAKAVAYALYSLEAKACIFNRTISKAKALAQQYGFTYATLGPESLKILDEYSAIIIQTTSLGMNSKEPSSQTNDPLWFYGFSGKEQVMDIIYTPEITPMMIRAHTAGSRVQNGYKMLIYQAQEQFKIYTGIDTTLD